MPLSVDRALRKAQSHIKAGELAEAEELYKQVLSKFPKNKKAIQGYQKLKAGITSKGSSTPEPPQEKVQELISLYNQGQLTAAIDQAQILTQQYPKAFFVWNILGAANKSLGKLVEASKALKKVTELNPNYADGFSNLGVVLKNQGKLDEAVEAYKKAFVIKPDDAVAYYNMGNALRDKGEQDTSIDSYTQAIKIKPDYAKVYNNMGVALNDKGEIDAAIKSYRQALKIKPDYAESKHLLASLTGETTSSAPREYVEDLFDQYAPKFEHSLVEKLQYQTPKIITEMIVKRHPQKALGSVLDLGCGTGLAGLELKQFCENLDGIDLSESMLRQARAKGVYDKLIHGDITEHLAEADLDFDYFISTDVFIYVGELSALFRLIKSRNRRRAKLVFSTEHAEGKDFYLEKSGRYSHSKNYIEGLCIEYGYHFSHFEKTKLRKEKSEFLTGGLYLLDFDPA